MFRKNAEKKFHDDKFPDKSPKDWFLFRNFKMELYGKEVWIILIISILFKNIIINGCYFYIISFFIYCGNKEIILPRCCLEKMKIKDTTGKSYSLRAVFKESIRFFKEHALDVITRKTTLLPTDTSWVLTIPAIWSEPAKQFMRTAAEEVQ